MNPTRAWAPAIGLLVLASLSLPGAGAGTGPAGPPIKCWTNKDGLRECGNVVPPEYVQGGHSQVKRSGAVREVDRAKTPEEIQAERQQAEEEHLQRQRVSERVAQDRVLLHTFTTEDDLVLTRDGKVGVIESRIRLLESRVADLEKNRRQLQEQAAQEERAGKGMSPTLREDLERVERQIAEHRQFVLDQRREQDEIWRKFAGDLQRFRALKTGAVRPGDL
jgi:vacuolar-type H+-ATPase subunit I/STV1